MADLENKILNQTIDVLLLSKKQTIFHHKLKSWYSVGRRYNQFKNYKDVMKSHQVCVARHFRPSQIWRTMFMIWCGNLYLTRTTISLLSEVNFLLPVEIKPVKILIWKPQSRKKVLITVKLYCKFYSNRYTVWNVL